MRSRLPTKKCSFLVMLKSALSYWLLLLPLFWEVFDPGLDVWSQPSEAPFACWGENHEFGLNMAVEEFCPLVIPSEFTSVNLWGITPKPSAQAVFSRAIGSEGERDRERVNWKTFLWPFRMLRGIWVPLVPEIQRRNIPVFFRLK